MNNSRRLGSDGMNKLFNRLTLLLIASIWVALPLKAKAQDSLLINIPADTLDEVTVQSTHHQLNMEEAVGSISYLSPEDLNPERGSSTAFSDVAADVPGLIAQDRNNLALGERIMMRGMGWRSAFGIRGIQLVQNGIPLTLADGQTSSTIIEPAAIQRLQAIRGPASGYWGNGSNGVVSINTQPPADASPVYWRNSAGSYGLAKSYLQWNTSVNGRRISGYSSYMSSDGYRDHNAMEIIRLGANADIYSSSTNVVDLTAAWLAKPKAQHPGSLTEQAVNEDRTQARSSFMDTDAGEKAYQGQLGLNWTHSREQLRIENMVYGVRRLLQNRLPFGYITLERWAGGARSTTQYDVTDMWRISGGLDFTYQHDNRLERNNDGGQPGDQVMLDQLEEVVNLAGFVQTTLEFNRWRFTGSLRYDWLKFSTDDNLDQLSNQVIDRSGERNFNALSPYVGIQYNTDRLRYFANFGTAFQSPTTTELVNNPDEQQAGFNPYLDPQTSIGGEAGVATLGKYKGFSSEVTFFYIDVQELLLPYQKEPDGPTFYENSGNTRHVGMELQLRWNPDNYPVSAIGNYSLTKAQFVDFPGEDIDDNTVPGIPDHLIDARVVWQPGEWRITPQVKWSSRYPADNGNTAYAESYTDLQFTIARDFRLMNGRLGMEPFFQLENALDQNYSSSVVVNGFGGTYYEPAWPRSWKAGISISWK